MIANLLKKINTPIKIIIIETILLVLLIFGLSIHLIPNSQIKKDKELLEELVKATTLLNENLLGDEKLYDEYNSRMELATNNLQIFGSSKLSKIIPITRNLSANLQTVRLLRDDLNNNKTSTSVDDFQKFSQKAIDAYNKWLDECKKVAQE